jgi:translation elongation factor EF-G
MFRLDVNGKNYYKSKLAVDLGSQFLDDLDAALEVGFQQITWQGPLCGEPLYGLMFIVHELSLTVDESNDFNGELFVIFKKSS